MSILRWRSVDRRPNILHRPRGALTDFVIILASLSVLLINVPFLIQRLQGFKRFSADPMAAGTCFGVPRPRSNISGEPTPDMTYQRPGSHNMSCVNFNGSSYPSHFRFHYPPSNLRNFIHPAFFETSRDLPVRPGRSSGTCIAITSSPRLHVETDSDLAVAQPAVTPWRYAHQLLHALNSKRARSPDLLEKNLRTILLASGCSVCLPPEANDEASRKAYTERLSQQMLDDFSPASVSSLLDLLARQAAVPSDMPAQHTAALRDVARVSDMDVAVLPSHPAACMLLQNVERLLAWAPPSQIEQEGVGWHLWLQRVKLTLDFIYTVRQCLATSPSYVLLLQDDVIPVDQWDTGIERFVAADLQSRPPWTLLSLHHPHQSKEGGQQQQHGDKYLVPCCTQALLFNASELPALLTFVEEHISERPLHSNLHEYLVSSDKHGYVHVPSLFQHSGTVLQQRTALQSTMTAG